MSWHAALSWLALGLTLVCLGILLYFPWRDRHLRGRRIKNREIERERITRSMPNFALRDFKDRR